ncbi:MAG: hypothetical protein IJV25_06410 [Prevotella sp.]|nr:hypothetical protein [Prevotella sp.]
MNSTLTTTAVICFITYRILLWAARIMWFCFRVAINLAIWLISTTFWTVVFLTRIIL